MARTRVPTIKQRKFVKEYLNNGGNGTQAALVAYDTSQSTVAADIASDNLGKPEVQELINQALEKAKLTNDSLSVNLAEALKKGLASERWTGGDAIKALNIAFKLKGAFPAHKSINANLNLNKMYEGMKYQEVLEEINKRRELRGAIEADLEGSTSPLE